MRKITAGFKCDPQLKEDLLSEAGEHGITLSEYLETLCENRHSRYVESEYTSSIDEHDEELNMLQETLEEYEGLLRPMFEKHKGQETLVILPDGTETHRFIKEPVDVLYTLINAIEQ